MYILGEIHNTSSFAKANHVRKPSSVADSCLYLSPLFVAPVTRPAPQRNRYISSNMVAEAQQKLTAFFYPQDGHSFLLSISSTLQKLV